MITTTTRPVKSYEYAYIRVVVKNQGAVEATGVLATHSGIERPDVFGWWACDGDASPVTCDLGAIPPGGWVEYWLRAHAPESGTLTLNSSVSSAVPDANPGDNTTSSSVTVESSPFADVSCGVPNWP